MQEWGGQAASWTARLPSVDVVVPLRPGEHASLAHCLSALARQTVRPANVVLIDDGGAEADHSLQLATEFARANGLRVECIARRWPIGHVATLKRQARASGAAALLVLQPDTVLDTPDYLAACLATLAADPGVACASGRALVLQPAQRAKWTRSEPFRRWVGADPYQDPLAAGGPGVRLARWLSASLLSHVQVLGALLCDRPCLQSCGGVMLAGDGAAVYRCRYLRDLFARVEPVRGDDLGAWPGHVIAHILLTEGYRLARVDGVVARVQPPSPRQWPALAWAWLLGLLQAGHWFDVLLRSPLRMLARHPEGPHDPYGERMTRLRGRRIGGLLLLRVVVLAGLSLAAWGLALAGQWTALGVLAAAEVVGVGLLVLAGPGSRPGALLRALVATPLRWGVITAVPLALARMAGGLWCTRRFRWRRNEVREASARGR